jgi:hypothetical protein
VSRIQSRIVEFDECEVTTIANTKTIIPAGRNITIEIKTSTGGVSVRPAGQSIDIGYIEWKRLQDDGLVRE